MNQIEIAIQMAAELAAESAVDAFGEEIPNAQTAWDFINEQVYVEDGIDGAPGGGRRPIHLPDTIPHSFGPLYLVAAARLLAARSGKDTTITETLRRDTETHFNQVRVKDLLDSTTSFLYCPICDGRYSANKADYFMRSPDHVLTCCNEPMWLATESRTITRQAVGGV